MKVAQEIDVDNVTIIINPQTNKLEAKIPPSTTGSVEIEELPNVTPSNSIVMLDGTPRQIIKLGKVKGTDWLVFQLNSPKPRITREISIEFYDDVASSTDGYEFIHDGKIRVITTDGSPFTPNGSPSYSNYYDPELRVHFMGGTTQEEFEGTYHIDFNTMTYQGSITYSEEQSGSSLNSVHLLGSIGFTVEHDDAYYDFVITNASKQ